MNSLWCAVSVVCDLQWVCAFVPCRPQTCTIETRCSSACLYNAKQTHTHRLMVNYTSRLIDSNCTQIISVFPLWTTPCPVDRENLDLHCKLPKETLEWWQSRWQRSHDELCNCQHFLLLNGARQSLFSDKKVNLLEDTAHFPYATSTRPFFFSLPFFVI